MTLYYGRDIARTGSFAPEQSQPKDLHEAGQMLVPLMYPHAYDRYRALQIILRRMRDEFRLPGQEDAGVGQKLIAMRARVGQPTVSNLENLQESLHSPKRHVGREELLKVLAWGFELEQIRVEALMWLYDGRTLSPGEVRAYLRGYIPDAVPTQYTRAELKAIVIDELERYVGGSASDTVRHLAEVRLLANDKERREGIIKASLVQECLPGQRMLLRESISLMALRGRRGVDENVPPELETPDVMIAARRSRACYEQSLSVYGERSIHSLPALKTYLDPATDHSLPIEARRRHVAHVIDLMKREPLYEVGFSDTSPELGILCKSFSSATILSAMRNWWDWPYTDWGPAAIQFWDTRSVMWFVLLFERHWDALPAERRDRRYVIPWLEAELAASSR